MSPEKFHVLICRLLQLRIPKVTWFSIIVGEQKSRLFLRNPWAPTIQHFFRLEDFIILVIFVHFFDFGDLAQESLQLQVLELFSGVARVAKIAHHQGYRARAYDINYDKGPKKFRWSTHNKRKKRSFMDLNGSAGLASLG